MKKFLCLTLILGTVFFISCKSSQEKEIPYSKMFKENPVTINWQQNETSSDNIESFKANVSVYSMNNRTDTSSVLQSKYKMSLSTINEIPYSRLDFSPEFEEGKAYSVVSNNSQIILFDTFSNKIEYKISMQENISQDLAFLGMENAVSRVNLDLIKSESKRLSLDLIEDSKKSLTLDIPNSYFFDNSNSLESRISTRVMFDVEQEVLSQVEVVSVRDNGTKITTNSYPMYQDNDGTPVKIGLVTVVKSEATELLQGFEDAQYFNSIDEIPKMSDAEYERILKSGEFEEVKNMTFGNPADLSYEETILEVYSDIEINTVDKSAFRILLNDIGDDL